VQDTTCPTIQNSSGCSQALLLTAVGVTLGKPVLCRGLSLPICIMGKQMCVPFQATCSAVPGAVEDGLSLQATNR
jgi:hypothetical protein